MKRPTSAALVILRDRWPWAAGYAAAVVVLALVGLFAWLSVAESYAEWSAATATRDQLELRSHGGGAKFSVPPPAGSAFLEGPTVTVAGAALQQKVSDAVSAAGGLVLSSQIDLQGARAAEGFINLVIICDATQDAVQKILHDLESGMPVIFVDQIVVQAAAGVAAPSGRLRTQIALSGRWQAPR